MFEGLVLKLLLGYLGRYVKDFQKDQLKITIWNEEVLLENVELNLEAFDYLQLPFGLKQGRVGRLSIKIPWKKLGRDPFIIILEDVFICASQRDDKEWSSEEVDKREFSGKKAKLAAAELAKLSRRVCDNQAGQSFLPYITAKALDNIQVSIKNFHAVYYDMQRDLVSLQVHALFGLRFSSLTIMNHSMSGSFSGRGQGGEFNKIVDILGFEIYCSVMRGDQGMEIIEGAAETNFWSNAKHEGNKSDYILSPFDVSLSLSVNRSGKLDIEAPQYSMCAEIRGLAMSLNEVQLQQLLFQWDYLCTSELREKYGRYRPWSTPISQKGWKIAWWHYAQLSVLSDVRKKRSKTSWSYFGQRLSFRRKYIKLYKAKLDILRHDQPIDEELLHELEELEKESDIDDILNYRSAAENELKMNSSNSWSEMTSINISGDKSVNDERSVSKPRGWLNWLSRGMLGAGGTDDSSQFSGVVSDDVIKDIYKATKFHPLPVPRGDSTVNDKILFSAINLSVNNLSLKLRSRKFDLEIAELILHGVTIESKIWKEHTTIIASVNSGEMDYSCNGNSILLMNKPFYENSSKEDENSSFCVQIDISSVPSDAELSVKVMVEPVEITCNSDFILNLVEFYTLITFFKFLDQRVLTSLNGIGNIKDRLLSKSEYIFSRRKKVIWDVTFINTTINIPWTTVSSESYCLVVESGCFQILSKSTAGVLATDIDDQASVLRKCPESCSSSGLVEGFQFQDLYDHFEIKLKDVEVKIVMCSLHQTVSVCEKFCCSITMAFCIIPDETILKQMLVHINALSLHAHFSVSKYSVFLGFIAHINMLKLESKIVPLGVLDSYRHQPTEIVSLLLSANLDFVNVLVNLENDGEDSSLLAITLHDFNIRYTHMESEEVSMCIKALKILTYSLTGERDSQTLCSTGNLFTTNSTPTDTDDGFSHQMDSSFERRIFSDGCVWLHYEAFKNVDVAGNKCTVCLNYIDLHCYPHIFGLLAEFFYKLSDNKTSGENSEPVLNDKNGKPVDTSNGRKFGFSNFSEIGSSDNASIPLEQFPFITIKNCVALGNLESSLVYQIPEWRKYFNLKETKVRRAKSCVKKSSVYYSSPLKSTPALESLFVSGYSDVADIFAVDLKLSGLKIHFHDSSCVIGTLSLPIAKTSLSMDINCVDILCSVEGLTLSSSWWTKSFHEPLWGPSLPNLSPILNASVKIRNCSSLISQIDICIAVQHVCCILPSELLSIIVGYCNLPEWRANADMHPLIQNSNNGEVKNISSFTYKVEILDSVLISPVESDDSRFLILEIPQLHCSFVEKNVSFSVLKYIPTECLVPMNLFAEEYHSLNIFGRDLSLAVLVKNDRNDCFLHNKSVGHTTFHLTAPFSADVWVIIPFETELSNASSPPFTCIMTRIITCQLIAEHGLIFYGFEVLEEVINQFSSMVEDSKAFTGNVSQFLQFKRSSKEKGDIVPDVSNTFIAFKCCVDSLVIKFYPSRNDPVSFKSVANADMQIMCSASFRNDIMLSLDISFSSLRLNSELNCVKLAQCSSTFANSSVLDFHLSVSEQSKNELDVSLPSLDIWLHFFEWNVLIEILSSYTGRLGKASISDASSKKLVLESVQQNENVMIIESQNELQSPSMSTDFSATNIKADTFGLTGKSGDIGVTFHIPVCSTNDDTKHMPQSVSSNIDEGKYSKFVTVTLHSKKSELSLSEGEVRMKSNIDKISGEIGICEDKSLHSWPLFQISQVYVDAEICNYEKKPLHLKTVVQSDRLDVWLSHRVFDFCHGMGFKVPEAQSSQMMVSNLNLEVNLKKVSVVLTDGRWSCNGPLLEARMKDLLLHIGVIENNIEGFLFSGLEVNYNNIHKVLWEPFVEPTKFQLSINRKQEMNSLLNSSMITDICLQSTAQLNINLTESLIESIFRAAEMIKEALGVIRPNDIPQVQRIPCYLSNENISAGRYAPYIVQNLTSMPLIFHIHQGVSHADETYVSSMKGQFLKPGSSVPIYIHETPEEQLSRYSPASSSGRLSDQQSSGVAHHFIIIQFDGTSTPSAPISMDLVGLTYFEVDLSKPANKMEHGKVVNDSIYAKKMEVYGRAEAISGFVVPVVFDVSVQRYSKLVRMYSTVILLNSTSTPLELRFDIPFGVSSKLLDPIYPGQEFPLPLHLAEAGRLRWRPLGNTYLWSEAHILSNVISCESRIGFLRSFVCYPSHPSSEPFRCCISVQDIDLPSSDKLRRVPSLYANDRIKDSDENRTQKIHNLDKSKKRYIHQVTLSTPLLVKNYLSGLVSLTIESGGVTRTAILSEVETSFFHIDSSYDLGLVFVIYGYRPSGLKFHRMDTFSAMAKLSGTRFSLLEVLTFDSDSGSAPMCVMVEKVMDAFSGAREVIIFVPFLLYNCTGDSLVISDSSGETLGNICTIPSCYDLVEHELFQGSKDGLAFLSLNQLSNVNTKPVNTPTSRIVSARNNHDPYSMKFLSKPILPDSSTNIHDSDGKKSFSDEIKIESSSSFQLNKKESDDITNEYGKVKPCMYSPKAGSSAHEIMVRLCKGAVEGGMGNASNLSWSIPFCLAPPSGSTYVFVPQQSTNAVSIISVTSSTVAEPFAGRTKIVTFQPRYVISNACSKDLSYKQKGTDYVLHLGVGQHSHLQWTDVTREMLVSIRFNEPGWQWSGSFFPDHLGDTQVKMWNYVSGASNMIRIEVQNADVSIQDENIVGNLRGNSGTNLILISDDDTGFMPYRIDNFSMERLRVYQQRCENFETIVQSYTSCPYAWDEPFFPHRLTVEVPGERVLGSYTIDDVKDYLPVYLPCNFEKPERTFLVSVHAEGAMKVLSIIDSSYHVLKDTKDPNFLRFKGKEKYDQKEETFVNYREKISLIFPHIGISLINCLPQELLFACAKNITIDLLQSLDRQKLSFQISTLQIDNQLNSAPYPVLLSFNHEHRSNLASQVKISDDSTRITNDNVMRISSSSLYEPVLCLAASKWRKKDISLISYEYISLRIVEFFLQLDQEVILSLLDLYGTVSSRFQGGKLPYDDYSLLSPNKILDFLPSSSTNSKTRDRLKAIEGQFISSNIPMFTESYKTSPSLPLIVPIGAPWQRIYLLAKRQKKIYIESIYLAPIRLTLSFSSTPWKLRNGIHASGESVMHRGLMAFADVEGAQINLKQLTISHHMGSFESIEEILLRHYMRQFFQEMYKVFGSAGVIGNPLGFARSLGLGIRDFLSAPAKSVLHSPTGLITGMAQGTTSLLNNTVYAISDAASQISRAAHKGIVTFTFDDQAVEKMEKEQMGVAGHSKGVLNEILEGLTGLLQSPIKGAEKHGLPGVVSGIAVGVTGLVAKPAASILEVTGKTAQSIRNRSKLHQMRSCQFRTRLPRPVSRELPLRPYSWEEAVGTSLLLGIDDGLKLKDERLLLCKALKEGGKFVVITEKLILVVNCSSLVNLGKPEFLGIPDDPEWVIEKKIGLESVIHADAADSDTNGAVVHIVGSNSETLFRQTGSGGTNSKRWHNHPTTLPLFQTNFELASKEEADNLLQVLLSTVELGKQRGWGSGHLFHQSNLKTREH